MCLAHLGTLHVEVHFLSVHDNLVPEHHLVEAVLLGDVLRCEVQVEGLHVPVEQGGQVGLEIEVDECLVVARVVIIVTVPSQARALALHQVHFAENRRINVNNQFMIISLTNKMCSHPVKN